MNSHVLARELLAGPDCEVGAETDENAYVLVAASEVLSGCKVEEQRGCYPERSLLQGGENAEGTVIAEAVVCIR